VCDEDRAQASEVDRELAELEEKLGLRYRPPGGLGGAGVPVTVQPNPPSRPAEDANPLPPDPDVEAE